MPTGKKIKTIKVRKKQLTEMDLEVGPLFKLKVVWKPSDIITSEESIE